MILSDRDIKAALAAHKIKVEPLYEGALQPASVDLHLGSKFLIFRNTAHAFIDVREPIKDLMEEVEIAPNRPFVIHPGEFALGVTIEKISLGPDMVGRLEGKSSLGRIGIIIHATAGFIDPGNSLRPTLELHNIGNLPVKLYYDMPIAQIAFMPLSSAAEHPYNHGHKYYGALEPQASKIHENFKKSS
ncbi:MAG: dCTP deaminase [Candidatus Kerfeldbacteria bacterium]|nr:dCTP deaminase [Candidatus Kerfeldbacteria bacterium]